MRSRFWLLAAVVAVVMAAVGGAIVVRDWDPGLPDPAPDVAAGSISREQLMHVAAQRVFFGHMSVGWNLLSGVGAIYSSHGLSAPPVIQVGLSDPAPLLPKGRGAIVHAEIGVNGDPLGKLSNFDTVMRSGMASEVDIAVLKFCYTDITSGTDVEAVFDAYSRTLDALHRDFPTVKFLAATVPLEVGPMGVKAKLKTLFRGDPNTSRERYNTLIRQHFGAEGILDVALAEGTAPDGTVSPSLYPPYSSDGRHLNASGSSVLAARFLQLIARTAA